MNKVEEYKIVFYYSPDDNCYLAEMPELPGCIADGETVSSAIENVREVAKDCIEINAEAGEDIPKPALTTMGNDMADVEDVALFILSQTGDITTKALQKLAYYCNAWCLGWYGKPLISQQFQAWRDGPVCPQLFSKHRHMRIASKKMFSPAGTLTGEKKRFIRLILSVYNDMNGDELSDLTHREMPWIEAREGLLDSDNGTNPISDESMKLYYGQGSTR